ncbi:hypothetical protein SEA_DJUNGELSKOG_20 [Arthrobacter phage Djungelskog]|nr:hypothetical protein PBI_STAYER_20 [Arthrobacter phage Stayer]QFG09729.1 hypothetical protein PBI_SHIBA_20 [Arthrobacter phage Shiba]QFG10164.1 hypothetical protein PBI_EGAD_20 [Arthrobacter phage Egad]QFG12617.1 hypothetical protein PBI_MICHELLE_20 [Arthrobacter phage Michelle]WKW85738.1 hypothetical protein SEA_MRAARONIAN_20 [Arthrobacter phage MrAaronian]WNO27625.1 hypothetical protein SEA_DJUNGELSKOG_20 [Arthrobacter phage Djungelskog]
MGAPYDNIPGVDSSDNFHPDIRDALLASEQFNRIAPTVKSITDWNDAVTNGWYYAAPSVPNSPVNGFYIMGEVVASPTSVTQTAWLYTAADSTDTKAYRRFYRASAWTPWFRLRMSEEELDSRYWQTAVTELGQEDLNTVTTPGDYHQSQNADAAAAANYPRPDAGFLTVRAVTNFIYQEYSTYQASAMRYWRAKYNSNWSAWQQIQPFIAAGTTAQYYRGDKTWQTLNASAVGLGSVNNTADSAKPVSTAQQTAIDLTAKGLVWQQKSTTPTGSIGGSTTVVLNCPSFVFKANRRYRIEWVFEYSCTTSGTFMSFDVHSCSTADAAGATTGLTKLGGSSLPSVSANTGHNGRAQAYLNYTSDTTKQIKVNAWIWNGSGTMIVNSSASNPSTFSIYDEGMQI